MAIERIRTAIAKMSPVSVPEYSGGICTKSKLVGGFYGQFTSL
ncbi:hypothetical protein [Nostoc sp.]